VVRADEIQLAAEGVWVWQAYDPHVKCDLTSAALRIGQSLMLVDPIALGAAASEELEYAGRVELIVCTSGNHARAADAFRKRYGSPIAAHSDAGAELGFAIDEPLADGARLLGAIDVCALPGAAAGEIALVLPQHTICVGDALIHLPPHGFSVLPDKYCADPKLLRDSLRKLLRWDFRILTFAHGWPLVASARERLAALLA